MQCISNAHSALVKIYFPTFVPSCAVLDPMFLGGKCKLDDQRGPEPDRDTERCQQLRIFIASVKAADELCLQRP